MKKNIPYNNELSRLIIVVMLHLFFAAGALLFAFFFRFDFSLGLPDYPFLFWLSLPVSIVIYLIFCMFFNLFHGIWRYVSIDDLKDIVMASICSAGTFFIVIRFSGYFTGYPRSIYLLNFILLILFNGGTRFAIRLLRESFAPSSEFSKYVLVIGAGQAGNELVRTLKQSKSKEFIPIGFIDEDASKHGHRLQNIKILGDITTIKLHIHRYHVQEVLIAIPEATNEFVQKVMQETRIPEWDVRLKIVPSKIDVMSGKYEISQIRDVSISDLLSRPNITLDDTHIKRKLNEKRILITGAGGSIGTEICLQVAGYQPSQIALLDLNEQRLIENQRLLIERYPHLKVECCIGNIADKRFIHKTFQTNKPDIVFHAAAYKHVHLMEWNPFASLRTNVLGTSNLAHAAESFDVKQFIMISTDKAVHPKGIMGISKRLAERVILERAESKTIFNVVRFGNVLGSSGSVIPLFQKQIQAGGPLTVTSPDARRFFMSIPEAVQLVLQASTLNESNGIFMLDMGKPVKIADLAKNLIELSGLKVGEDIEIVFTGLRPGEKVEEELLSTQENLIPTEFEKIRLQKNTNFNPVRINRFVTELDTNIDNADITLIYSDIKELVPEMTGPSLEEIKERMFS